jgi:hypothetical protein
MMGAARRKIPVNRQTLRLYTDRLGPGVSSDALAPTNRTIYVAEGTAVIRDGGSTAALGANSAWQGHAAITIAAGPAGARLLRWDFSAGDPALLAGANLKSELTLEGMPRIDQGVDYLMRCDRVDFPPGGVAFTHTHQGSGIRCLQNGRIRIETEGHDFWIEPDGAWFETGHDPVFAETWPDGPSHFIRVMILPRAIRGKSSIRYVNAVDQDRPKSQKYQVFVDEPIA